MANDKPPRARYATRYCALLKRDVDVVLIQRADGRWALTHCREKSKSCDGQECPPRRQGEDLLGVMMWGW